MSIVPKMGTGVFLVVVLAVAVALFAWWLIMLIDALRIPSTTWQSAGQNQLIYVLLMVFLGLVGTVLYVAVARPKLRGAG